MITRKRHLSIGGDAYFAIVGHTCCDALPMARIAPIGGIDNGGELGDAEHP